MKKCTDQNYLEVLGCLSMAIRRLRKRLAMTRKEFGDPLSVTPQCVYSWEKGRCLPTFDMVRLISEKHCVAIDDLAWGKIK